MPKISEQDYYIYFEVARITYDTSVTKSRITLSLTFLSFLKCRLGSHNVFLRRKNTPATDRFFCRLMNCYCHVIFTCFWQICFQLPSRHFVGKKILVYALKNLHWIWVLTEGVWPRDQTGSTRIPFMLYMERYTNIYNMRRRKDFPSIFVCKNWTSRMEFSTNNHSFWLFHLVTCTRYIVPTAWHI